jgi:hypothetical protein
LTLAFLLLKISLSGGQVVFQAIIFLHAGEVSAGQNIRRLLFDAAGATTRNFGTLFD